MCNYFQKMHLNAVQTVLCIVFHVSRKLKSLNAQSSLKCCDMSRVSDVCVPSRKTSMMLWRMQSL